MKPQPDHALQANGGGPSRSQTARLVAAVADPAAVVRRCCALSVNVRHATVSDANAIAEIHVSTWRDTYRGQIPDAILDALDVSQRADFWRGVLSADHSVIVAVWSRQLGDFIRIA
jgi:hypothetical protein